MSPRRLLVISYHFTPDGAVGGLRWAGLSKYLSRLGWEVHVITAAAQNSSSRPDGVHVHYVPPMDTVDVRYKRWASQRSSCGGAVSVAGSPASAPTGAASLTLVGKLRRIAAEVLIVPDYARGWLLRAAHAARELIRHEPFDVVVSSGPPHSVHLAAKLATAGLAVPRVVDMRDPWVPVDPNFPIPPVSLQYAMLPALERSIINGASLVIANTSAFASSLEARYAGARIGFVPNGIDLERLPAASNAKFDGVSIAYAGSMYLERNLSPVLRAMQTLFSANPAARSHCFLRIAGGMDGPHADRFLGDVAALGLAENVITLGHVSGAQALDLINRSHLALVLAQNQPVQVPAKLYECVALGVPTLVLTELTSAAASEARRIGALACDPHDDSGITDILRRALRGDLHGASTTGTFAYDAVARDVSALLETVGGGRVRR